MNVLKIKLNCTLIGKCLIEFVLWSSVRCALLSVCPVDLYQ